MRHAKKALIQEPRLLKVKFEGVSIEQTEAILAVAAKINAANETAKRYAARKTRRF
jgi:3-deoxy-D-arabino-heptulosonate 7-phosphate (DAHP) synthase